jgi:hypothetical protein
MPNGMSTRPVRVGSTFAWEVAKHTTERDREIAWLLYRQKILTTDQLRLLFLRLAASLPGSAAVAASPSSDRPVLPNRPVLAW